MLKRKAAFIVFILLTLAHVFIFLNRSVFQYKPYASYQALYEACDADCESKWKKFAKGYPANEQIPAKILADSITRNQLTTRDKALALASWLVTEFHHRLGNPDENLLRLSPWQQLINLRQNPSLSLWCSNYAQIFSWLCWSQGITNRNIEILKKGDRHVVNEVYLPETREWMLFDLTSNLLAIEGNGITRNLVTLRRELHSQKSLKVFRVIDGQLKDTVLGTQHFPLEYYDPAHSLVYYHTMNYFKTQHAWYRLKAYVWPLSWYDIYEETRHNNRLFYLKQLLLVLWLISFLAILPRKTKFKA